jgi:hypothetical protein
MSEKTINNGSNDSATNSGVKAAIGIITQGPDETFKDFLNKVAKRTDATIALENASRKKTRSGR